MTIYKAFEEAKNGTMIPLFLSGKTMESRYNPQRDAENLFNSINQKSRFFLVFGIGSGIFIELLSKNIPDARIIGLELYSDDLTFLLQSERIKKLSESSEISFVSLDQLQEKILQNYLPAKFGELCIVEQRAWVIENSSHITLINKVLNKALGIIKADYSVQSHFGKIWTSNIMNNCKLAESNSLYNFENSIHKELNKTAVIIAAGPSLDKTVSMLVQNNTRNNYYIFATDTAGQTLIKKGITPDVIVSIDGQSVSYNHFITKEKKQNSKTIYAFDLCSNSSAVRHLFEAGSKLMFFSSGHPLSTAINSCNSNYFPCFFSGAGTVTITALDMAVQAGFKKILLLGADFSYPYGKAYASGTYLDILYNQKSSKLTETEKIFLSLMFRTELINNEDNIKTTEILNAYKLSLENYLAEKKISFKKENGIYYLECHTNNTSEEMFKKEEVPFSLKNFFKKIQSASADEIEVIFLPYIAWLRKNSEYKDLSYKELLKLALESIVRYNI